MRKRTERLEWMYKGAIGVSTESEREEYLLGKPIDRQVDALIQEKEKEEEMIKTKEGALFMKKGKTSFAKDLAVKIREDPLLAIKQKEEERKKYILNNPLKLKKIRDYIERKQNKHISDKKVKTPKINNQNSHFKESAVNSRTPLRVKKEYKRDVTYFNPAKKRNEEEMEKKRAEMIELAAERDTELSERVARIREKLKNEEARDQQRPKRNFTQDLRKDSHKVYDKLDLESSIRRNKYKIQRRITDLEDGMQRK